MQMVRGPKIKIYTYGKNEEYDERHENYVAELSIKNKIDKHSNNEVTLIFSEIRNVVSKLNTHYN